MWRSFFLAIGVTVCLLGVETLAVERAVVKSDLTRSAPTREVVPPHLTPPSHKTYLSLAAQPSTIGRFRADSRGEPPLAPRVPSKFDLYSRPQSRSRRGHRHQTKDQERAH